MADKMNTEKLVQSIKNVVVNLSAVAMGANQVVGVQGLFAITLPDGGAWTFSMLEDVPSVLSGHSSGGSEPELTQEVERYNGLVTSALVTLCRCNRLDVTLNRVHALLILYRANKRKIIINVDQEIPLDLVDERPILREEERGDEWGMEQERHQQRNSRERRSSRRDFSPDGHGHSDAKRYRSRSRERCREALPVMTDSGLLETRELLARIKSITEELNNLGPGSNTLAAVNARAAIEECITELKRRGGAGYEDDSELFGEQDQSEHPTNRPPASLGRVRQPSPVEKRPLHDSIVSRVDLGRVFISNLSEDVTEKDLYNLFSQVGPIQDTKRIPPPRNYAFVTMELDHHVEEVVQRFNGTELKGNPLVVKRNVNSSQSSSSTNKSSGKKSAPSNSKKQGPVIPAVKDCVLITNLPSQTTKNEVVSLCAKYGMVQGCVYQHEANEKTGSAVVRMKSEAQAALLSRKLHGNELYNSKMIIMYPFTEEDLQKAASSQ